MTELISSPAGGDPAPVPAGNDVDPGDDRDNNIVATGALYGLLRLSFSRAEVAGAELTDGQAGNRIDVRFPFLRSAYRLTIERVPGTEVEVGAGDG